MTSSAILRAVRTITSPAPASQPLLRHCRPLPRGARTAMLRRARRPLSRHLGSCGQRVNRSDCARKREAWRLRRPSSVFRAIARSAPPSAAASRWWRTAAWWRSSPTPRTPPARRSAARAGQPRSWSITKTACCTPCAACRRRMHRASGSASAGTRRSMRPPGSSSGSPPRAGRRASPSASRRRPAPAFRTPIPGSSACATPSAAPMRPTARRSATSTGTTSTS